MKTIQIIYSNNNPLTLNDKKHKKFLQSIGWNSLNNKLSSTSTSSSLEQYTISLLKQIEILIQKNELKSLYSVLKCLELTSQHLGWVWAYNRIIATIFWEHLGSSDEFVKIQLIESIGIMSGIKYDDDDQKISTIPIVSEGLMFILNDDYSSFELKKTTALALQKIFKDPKDLAPIKDWVLSQDESIKNQLSSNTILGKIYLS